MSNEKQRPKWDTFGAKFWLIFSPFLAALFVFLSFPYLFTQKSWVDFDLAPYGPLGDAINGIIGPFVAIVAAILTFIAFWVQYIANKQQRDDLKLERFETKYYELIRLHKANVDEVSISNRLEGRKAFAALYDELRFTYHVVETVFEDYLLGSEKDRKVDAGFDFSDLKTKSTIAFLVFFYGTGEKSDKLLVHTLRGSCTPDFLGKLSGLVTELKQKFRQSSRDPVSEKQQVTLTRSRHKSEPYEYRSKYTPFEGHSARLGHYYRHLYQTVKYVNEAPILKDDDVKYQYVKTLRAQLSNYEQILLYFNALTPIGSPWLDADNPVNSLIARYKLIKNMPLPLVDFGVKPEEEFAKVIEHYREKTPPEEFFEWDELKKG